MTYYHLSSLFFTERNIQLVCKKEKDKNQRIVLERRFLKHGSFVERKYFSMISNEKQEHYFGIEEFFQEKNLVQENRECYILSESLIELFQLYCFYYLSTKSSTAYSQEIQTKTIPAAFLKILLKSAVQSQASDIHLEIFEQSSRIRFRRDGSLQTVLEMETEEYSSLISQIKIIANLDIVERRMPQDGSFSLNIVGQEIDFRISTLPSLYGEKIAIRILDRSQSKFHIENLGFSIKQLEEIKKILSRKSGLILNCGPTGSGKTTTLYSFLNHKVQEEINIVSVEDPIEYHLHGVTQVACREEIGLDYPLILRTLLRQDPDVIMIGEIRDRITAEIAVKAALTGHLVISTIHARDSIQCIERLCNLGIDPFLIANSLVMILSQRLLKKLCPFCQYKLEKEVEILDVLFSEKKGVEELYETRGCIRCQNQGYKGRVAIFELFLCDEENRNWILSRSLPGAQPKVETLLDDALSKLEKGIVSFREVVENL